MWLYYEDKGKYLGMTKTKHNELKNFIDRAINNKETIHIMSDVKLPNFDKNHKLEIIFDIPSFMNKINLDCLHCNKVHTRLSCCDGAPYPFDIKWIENLLFDGSLIPYVRDEFRNDLRLCSITKDVTYVYSLKNQTLIPKTNSDGIRECPLRGYDRCGLHAYLLDNGIPYYKKPCTWLYPLDYVLEIDKQLRCSRIFVFVLCERTSKISRWGETSCYRHCLDEDLNDFMIENNYNEFYGQKLCDKKTLFQTKGL